MRLGWNTPVSRLPKVNHCSREQSISQPVPGPEPRAPRGLAGKAVSGCVGGGVDERSGSPGEQVDELGFGHAVGQDARDGRHAGPEQIDLWLPLPAVMGRKTDDGYRGNAETGNKIKEHTERLGRL